VAQPTTTTSSQPPPTTRANPPPTSAAPVAKPVSRPTKSPLTSSSSNNNNNNKPNNKIPAPPAPAPISPSSFQITSPQMNKNNENLSQATQTFVENHCDLTNLKEWYPTSDPDVWQQRAPYVVIAGVWNAGVRNLAQALSKHPQMDPKAVKTNGFFLPKSFYRYVIGHQHKKKVKVFAARQRMYAQAYKATILQDKEDTTATSTTSSKNMKIAMDVSPGYLFYASQVAYSILCTTPWTKMIILLQNPVDRVYKQWVYGRQHLNLRLNLEDWMAQEMKLMQSVGLIGGSSNAKTNAQTNKLMSLTAEQQAWKQYQAKRSLSGMPIGRSLYVLQLQEWLDAIKEAGIVGDQPTQQLYIMPSEVWESQTSQEYPKLIQFLGLAEYHPPQLDVLVNNNNNNNKNNNLPPMSNETRQMLQEFFAPYNERLAQLLIQNGFDSYPWKDLWK
jgi:hypothetical protein